MKQGAVSVLVSHEIGVVSPVTHPLPAQTAPISVTHGGETVTVHPQSPCRHSPGSPAEPARRCCRASSPCAALRRWRFRARRWVKRIHISGQNLCFPTFAQYVAWGRFLNFVDSIPFPHRIARPLFGRTNPKKAV